MTNLAAIISALSALLTSLVSAGVLLREIRKNRRATERVHTIVNSERTADRAYRLVLADALRRHGIVVPIDPATETVAAKTDEGSMD